MKKMGHINRPILFLMTSMNGKDLELINITSKCNEEANKQKNFMYIW